MSNSNSGVLPPVRSSVEVPCPPEEAFRVFTAGLNSWWPLGTYSVNGDKAVACSMEPRSGGVVFETDTGGRTYVWGTLTSWEPPNRLVIRWHPYGESHTAQEVEVRFTDRGSFTLVELEHRNWEPLGDEAAEIRGRYEGGWPNVLAIFAAVVGSPDSVHAGGTSNAAS